MSSLFMRRYAAILVLTCASLVPAHAQQTNDLSNVDIVLTPNRGPTSIQRSGSSISVIPASEIEKRGSVLEALRMVPGIDVAQTGGQASVTSLRLRGGTVGQTLVLVDGVRMNDPSGPASEFDFGMLSATDIERIEVLRGPQSALYGSDAMGGVINIITRRGSSTPRRMVEMSVGSYGTLSARGALSGATGPWSYAASLTGLSSEGFSDYGYRLKRLQGSGPFEKDGYHKLGGALRLGYRPHADFSVDTSLTSFFTRQHFDSSFGDDPLNKGWARLTNFQTTARLSTLDGKLDHRLSLFGALTERFINLSFGLALDYRGARYGGEYQGDLKLGQFGTLSFGLRQEQERLDAWSDALPRGMGFRTKDNGEAMNTSSAFLLHQFQPTERIDLSLAARIDHADRAKTFFTGRATAAYRITDDTKLRASFGSGAKSPTLYQLFSIYGTSSLSPETSIGYDAGIEHSLMQGRVKLGLGVFSNHFKDMINFGNVAICTPTQIFGCYYNTARARTRGVEATLDAVLIEDRAKLSMNYTYLDAEDSTTGLRLTRRARHQGMVALEFRPTAKLTISPSVKLVGSRADEDFDAFFNRVRVKLAPYARLDVAATYQLNETFTAFGRIENLNGARIEDVRNYGGTGRAAYGGLRASW